MIFAALDGSQAFYRAHTPAWASQPLSGAGAARKGGRLNRPGVNALYLAASPETAIAEYKQDEHLMPPFTMAQYHVTLRCVTDFRGGFDPASWGALWQELNCNWRGIAFLEGREPPSWVLGDQALEAGACGVLYPSSRYGGGLNLVVYTDAINPNIGERIAVHDPGRKLPRNRDSWGD